MMALASLRDTPIFFESPKSEIPYTIPKLTAFAWRRMLPSTGSSSLIPKIRRAVAAWISSPFINAACKFLSPVIWAKTRNSICE